MGGVINREQALLPPPRTRPRFLASPAERDTSLVFTFTWQERRHHTRRSLPNLPTMLLKSLKTSTFRVCSLVWLHAEHCTARHGTARHGTAKLQRRCAHAVKSIRYRAITFRDGRLH
ncbi:hypothetical protein E2C01_032194 [Portunus trituberculatus]|uniref:Uncharacterized protein n=1 Tax=Portunus trituberculatus TaxID=210409 RepID=A0A5B7F258_PORTR|nr:hypothetical protein [Portunus trituberculatus]